jgi:hypothetical protein
MWTSSSNRLVLAGGVTQVLVLPLEKALQIPSPLAAFDVKFTSNHFWQILFQRNELNGSFNKEFLSGVDSR